jgi:coproporphyrinogen III oxidase-like Fe-S oxidoreductase
LLQLTEELWGQSLELALDAGPHHMSVYDLQVEEHTPFAKQYSPGEAPLPSDDSAANMYCQASSTLRAAGAAWGCGWRWTLGVPNWCCSWAPLSRPC